MWTDLELPQSDWAPLTSAAADIACSRNTSSLIKNHSNDRYEKVPEYYPGVVPSRESMRISYLEERAEVEQTSFDWSAAAIGALCGGLVTFAAMKTFRRKQQQKAPINDAFI